MGTQEEVLDKMAVLTMRVFLSCSRSTDFDDSLRSLIAAGKMGIPAAGASSGQVGNALFGFPPEIVGAFHFAQPEYAGFGIVGPHYPPMTA